MYYLPHAYRILFFWHGIMTAQLAVIDTGMCSGQYVLLLK